jgi:hypothetical protein
MIIVHSLIDCVKVEEREEIENVRQQEMKKKEGGKGKGWDF